MSSSSDAVGESTVRVLCRIEVMWCDHQDGVCNRVCIIY